ncbi:MAG: GAP family protein [Rhodococcus sp. (in: high G+C Gram-positive bacteria)]
MSDLIWLLVPEMIGLVITPAAVIGCVLLLESANAVRNALAFGSAFLLVYSQIAVAALLGGAGDPSATSKTVSNWVGLIVGVVFLVVGVIMLARKPAPAGVMPKWMTTLESATPRIAFVAGLALGAINPNIFILLSGMTIISSSDEGVGAALLGTALLLMASMLDFAVPIAIFTVLGERAQRGLSVVKTWMVRHNRALGVAVFFGFGTLFALRGLLALV